MTDHIDSLWRFVAIVDLMVLLCCGTAVHLAYRDAMPKLAWRAGWGYGLVLVVLVVAVGINAVLGEPLTVGQQIVTAGITPAAAWIGTLVACEVRHGWRAARSDQRDRIVARADEVATWAAHVEHAEPCATPDCQRFRAELLEITGHAPRPAA